MLALCQFELFLYRALGAKSLTAGSVDFSEGEHSSVVCSWITETKCA